MEMSDYLELPGLWIDGADRDAASDARLFLSMAVRAFNEALVSKRSFDASRRLLLQSDADAPSLEPTSPIDKIRCRIYGKAFVFALDELLQFVKILADMPSVPTEASSLCKCFADHFKPVRRIRNSLHHLEDRVRSLGPRNKPLTTQLLALFVIEDQKIGATTEKNCIEYVPVTEEFLGSVRGHLLDLIWAFQWLGPGNQRTEREI